ncbi:MAG: radical SAM protein [Candidatus Hydrogenedentota bacterium]
MATRALQFTSQPAQPPEYSSLRRWGLFDGMIFGPVQSRRFGRSLGINTLPSDRKICSFDCIYCELGRTTMAMPEMVRASFPEPNALITELNSVLDDLADQTPDTLTLTGNGEPTMHPSFEEIAAAVLDVRAKRIPDATVAVLTNGTYIDKPAIARALDAVDVVMLKLDAGTPESMDRIDVPLVSWNPDRVVRASKKLRRVVIQALFLEGAVKNTDDAEVERWIALLREIKPESVVIYTLDRVPPEPGLRPAPRSTLDSIGRRTESAGFPCDVL